MISSCSASDQFPKQKCQREHICEIQPPRSGAAFKIHPVPSHHMHIKNTGRVDVCAYVADDRWNTGRQADTDRRTDKQHVHHRLSLFPHHDSDDVHYMSML